MIKEINSCPLESKHNTRTNEAWSALSVFLFTVGLNASRASSYMYEMSSFAITDVLQKHNFVLVINTRVSAGRIANSDFLPARSG